MWRLHSRHKSKSSVPAVETSKTTAPPSSTPKSPSRTPTEASTSTFEALSTELERTQLAPRSGFSSEPPTYSRSRSADRSLDPLGLSVVYEPETDPSLDIIFVHGLGGSSRATWCYNRDLEFFWPQKWLPSEPEIQTARIMSFGYNAQFTAPGPAPIAGISDFAKDLLFGMKFAKNERLEELSIGKRPIIFIVHSMGGLVVKKAYTLGQNSAEYEEMVSSIKAILFLATPHKGSHLAELLNRILSVSIFNHTPKQYVAELSHTSRALEDLNDQFRGIAPKLQIISFYETLPTSIGPRKMVVLEKATAILGYPTEISKSLDADHHNVCKYKNRQDPNYVSVRNALKTMVSTLRVEGQQSLGNQENEQLKQLENFLVILESPSEDLTFFQKRWTSGTCEWILSNLEYLRWVDGDKGSKVLWLHALPATGKSILSSFIINNMLETRSMCAYYFFRFGDQKKRSLSACLRSLAFQIAEQLPSFRKALYEISNTGVRFEKADARTIWQNLFASVLFKMTFSNTLYWIIDGLDETDSPRLLVELMRSISSSILPIKVMLVSRQSPELVSAFERLAAAGPIQSLTIEDNEEDISRYVEQEIDFMHAPDNLKVQVVRKLLERANRNFLWVNLAITEILQCLTPADVEETLEGLPSGMGELYHRMELSILKSTKPRDQDLAKTILMWTACPRRPLSLSELEQALQPEFPVLLDLSFTISQVCGQFIIIDSSKQIFMLHQTAREYLVKSTQSALVILPTEAHQKMFAKCMYFLDQSTQRRGSARRGSARRKSSHLADDKEHFLHYAATSWPYHLGQTSVTSNECLILITKFLRSMSVLAWISSLAEFGQLEVLAHASRTLNNFVRRKRNYDTDTNPLLHRLHDLELVELWATDLIKIMGKFGPNLTRNPLSIYKQIPPFCPQNSMIHRQFSMNGSGLSINGISSTSWDDSLAKISLGSDSYAVTMVCSGNHFAVLTTLGSIILYSTVTFEAVHTLRHGERVSAMSFSHSCDRLVSSGFRTTKVWSVAAGKVILQIQNPASARTLKIIFSADDSCLLIGSADRVIRICPLNVPEPAWSLIDQRLLREDNSLDRTVTNSPCLVSFSPDATHVAVAYRGFPLSVWSIDPPELIGRCRRNPQDTNNLWAPVDRAVWHPYLGEVLGIYLGGYVFKWHPYNGTHQEIYASASIIACSPEGTLFATGNGSGTIKLYDFDHFALVYQLSCENIVNDISFSPDSRQLYDLRGQFCNVWEPNALLRLDDIDGKERDSEASSDLGSLPTASISEAVAEIRDPITAISMRPKGIYCVAGNESGIVSIFSSSDVTSQIELFRSVSMLAIEHLDWGEDGQHLACAELGGRITVKLITPPGSDDKWAVKSIFDIKMEVEVGGIKQIMLNSDSTIMLIGNRNSATILSLNAKFDAVTLPLSSQSSAARWITHPTDPNLLLAFNVDFVRVYRWQDLVQIAVLEIMHAGMKKFQTEERPSLIRAGRSDDSVTDDNQQNIKINRLIATPTGSHILFQYTIASREEGRQHQTLIFDTFTFEGNKNTSSPDIVTRLIKPISLPEEIETRIEIPLGILSKNRFIYLDKEFSMCSLRLNASRVDEKDVHEHFFLPRDWLNSNCLELCTLLPDGAFLIPHNEEIAIIKSGVMLEW